jgi:hypothetical protein
VVLGKSKTRPEVERRGLAPRRWSPLRMAVSGRVAVPSFSRYSYARRGVRVVGGCCSRGESRGKWRMEELTGVVRSAEMKQKQNGQRRRREVEKWLNSLSQLERRVDKAGLDGHTRPALGRQCGREVAGGCAAVACARRQRPGGR